MEQGQVFLPNAFLTLSAPEGPNVVVTGYVEETLSNLQPGVPYYARVTAYNAMGWGSPKASVPPSLAPSNQRPPASRLVRLEAVSDSELRVQWKAPNMMAVRQFPNTALNGISMIILTAKLVHMHKDQLRLML